MATRAYQALEQYPAKKILDAGRRSTSGRTILEAYIKAGQTEEDALRNTRLARILRPGEYNSTTKEPILWTPPNPMP
jgi:hypothetical protein